MKRANGEGMIKEKRKGLWEGRYTIGYDEHGKQIRKSIYGKSQKEVAKKLNAITNDLNTGLYIAPDEITVSQWFDVWFAEYLGGIKASTSAQYEYQIRVHIKPALGSIKLQKLTAPMIQRFYNEKKSTLSAKSIKNLHGVIHKALNQAVLCQYLKSNPSLACQLPRIEKKEMHPLSNDTLPLFLAEIKGKQYEELFFVDVFTGLRESEIIGLTWDCVDFKKGIIHVDKQLKRERKHGGSNWYTFDTLKNGKTRVVTPAPVVFEVLKKVRSKQAENRLKYGSAYYNEHDLVFTNEIGGHLSPVTVLGCFKRRVAAIGKPETRFHDLRHTYATLSIQNHDDIKTVSENLGHATVAFTLDVYGHVTDQMRKDSADRMQAYIDSIGV